MPDPRRWSYDELVVLAGEAVERFRTDRTSEPRIYAEFFENFVLVFRDLIDHALSSLAETLADVDRELLAGIVSNEDARTAFRYLAAPPISDDDLRTLAASRLSPVALRTDQDQAERVRNVVLNVIDPYRFPWVEAGRSPTEQERETAIISSAVLVATQKVGTRRRNDAKKQQENRVKDLLLRMGFVEVRPRAIPLLEDGPRPGEFCGESKLGDTRADLVIRMPDRRYLAIECKVSNSAVNSFKRLNHEALGKARRWLSQFGTVAVVPAAVLSGVFNPDNLGDAQQGGLNLFGHTAWEICGHTSIRALRRSEDAQGATHRTKNLGLCNSPLQSFGVRVSIRPVDALARAYGPWWLCNDVTRPFWQSGRPRSRGAGPEREVDMVAIPMRATAPCPDAVLRGTRQRGRGGRVTDPSSLS